MEQKVLDFIDQKKYLLQSFNCKDNYFVEPIINYKWKIRNDDDVSILSYWKGEGHTTNLIIVKKNGTPIILNNSDDEYTLIVGINCIKIAYILKNKNKIS